jgi:predicted oxidoreductase
MSKTEATAQLTEHRAGNLVIGGGIAGIITALELLDGGQSVLLIDADTPQRFGGLAIWAFGGMALAKTREQKRMGVEDSDQLLLEDWIRFGELQEHDHWPLAWARCYADESHELVYNWLTELGLKFMPAVNWVERGESIKGNSVPRYHILWGTGRELVQTLIARLLHHPNATNLTVLHQHRAEGVDFDGDKAIGCHGVDLQTGLPFRAEAANTIVATGGINGSVEKVRENWPRDWHPLPDFFLNGANPLSDGAIHESVAGHGGALTHLDKMWNYAGGVPHPQAHFDGHGLALVPPKTCLWLDPAGQQLAPESMVNGFDTNEMCRKVVEYPYTWMVLNRKIIKKELAISGAEHNPLVVNHQLVRFLLGTLFGNNWLIDKMLDESPDFIDAGDWQELAAKMNALTGGNRIDADALKAVTEDYDGAMTDPEKRAGHTQISRIMKAREWRTDKLRTCNLQPIGDSKAWPLIAIRLHFISRKSMGGLQTDLQCRVLNRAGQPMPGLYAVGEAAGFGGGGASGKRSLEGTFLSGCILTARKAAAHLTSSG